MATPSEHFAQTVPNPDTTTMNRNHRPEPEEASEWEKLHERLLGSHVLAKACVDHPFNYALKLRSGGVINFTGARFVNPGWIWIDFCPLHEQPPGHGIPYDTERGMEIRVDEIVWVMDAPEERRVR